MQFTCDICTDAVPRKRFISCGCPHKYCAECLAKHFTTLIAAGQFANIGCPAQGCDTIATQVLIKRLVDTDSYERYEYLTLIRAAGNMPDVCYCPNEQCNWIVETDNTNGATCGKCKLEFCTKCRKHYHGHCDYDEQRERMFREQDEQANAMIASTTKSCPGCGSPIEKNYGCDHMTCTVCGNEFCWLCKATWANHWRCAR
ncbi:unnamed protein product [Medioppia subpectinata]|uniref:RBR-type E3 ubiquitin transferase n=1 Tax=Medioppia subpectinata TaxID=1979941 RepID=A0A7R9KYT6_9ACAR|nr:unnamed protein product [Medioppia subpectinata]CAG2112401.1 unnamed protein product [Medioppia subpectinata]